MPAALLAVLVQQPGGGQPGGLGVELGLREGKLLPNVEARIVDPASGADLGPGETTGELWLRSPQVMRGYHHRPEETAGMLGGDGWLPTGDLCTVDADGYVYVVDRLKELIKYKGHQVAPAELEHVLEAHPAVDDVAVVRRPDPEAGEVPVAYVALRGQATPEELMAYVAERVAPYKRVLRGGMEAVYVDMNAPVGLARVAPTQPARGPMFSARSRAGLPGSATAEVPVAEEELRPPA